MIVEIDIDAELDEVWRERIDRQISFKFASAGSHVRLRSVQLHYDKDAAGTPCFR